LLRLSPKHYAASFEQSDQDTIKIEGITIARDYVDFGLPLLDLISEGNIGLCENIHDDQSLTPFEFLSEKDFSEQIDRLLKTLNERETTIIAHRFGLNGMPVKPLEQVGELIGVTHERARRLELAALAKLRRAFNKHLGPVESEVFVAA
jgi:DNA-directed RNA polymerase sigma subunit (sigma70/sigma32)